MSEYEKPVRTLDGVIARDIPVYVPKFGLDYLGFTDSPLDRRLYNHITKRNISMPSE